MGAAALYGRQKNAGEDMAAICALLDWLVTRIDYIPPFDFFAQLLGARGGMARLAARLGPEINDPLGELMRLALTFEQQNTASMQGFLNWLEQGEQQIKRDMEARGDAIRIMTVHGAKGLEAPIVFLPDTCGRGVPTSSARTPFLLTQTMCRFGRPVNYCATATQISKNSAAMPIRFTNPDACFMSP